MGDFERDARHGAGEVVVTSGVARVSVSALGHTRAPLEYRYRSHLVTPPPLVPCR